MSGAYADPAGGPASPFGRIRIPGPQQPTDPTALLMSIDSSLKALVKEYVNPLTNFIYSATLPVAASATSPAISIMFDSGGQPVRRVVVQCQSGAFDLVYGNNGALTQVAQWTFNSSFGQPWTWVVPGVPLTFVLRNLSTTTPAVYGIHMSSEG